MSQPIANNDVLGLENMGIDSSLVSSAVNDFSFGSLMAGLVFGVVGMWLIRQAKVQAKFTLGLIGLLMMIYPLFVSGAWLNWGVGLALSYWAYQVYQQ